MSKFVVADELDELSYDFSPYGGTGKIPEPTNAQINSYRKAFAELIGGVVSEDVLDENQPIMKRVAEFLSRDDTEATQKILHAVAEVCSTKPSFDELELLPARAQQGFIGFVTGVFLTPKSLMPVTNDSPAGRATA
jgi:hypothetical protein